MRRDRLTITSASSGSVAPGDRRSGNAKVRASQAATSAGALPWVRSDFPRPVGRPPRIFNLRRMLLVPALSFGFYRVFIGFYATILTTLSSREYFLTQTQSAGD